MTDSYWMDADKAYQDKLDASEGRIEKIRASKKLRKSSKKAPADSKVEAEVDHTRERVDDEEQDMLGTGDIEDQKDGDNASLNTSENGDQLIEDADDENDSRTKLNEYIHDSARKLLSASQNKQTGPEQGPSNDNDNDNGGNTGSSTENVDPVLETTDAVDAEIAQDLDLDLEAPQEDTEIPEPEAAPTLFQKDGPVQDPKPRPVDRFQAIPTEKSIYFYLMVGTFWLVCVLAILIVVLSITLE